MSHEAILSTAYASEASYLETLEQLVRLESPTDDKPACDALADQLRANGVPCEVAATPQKFGKQIRYAERRGIPYVLFPGDGSGRADEIKDIRSGDQVDADPDTWTPPADDLRPRVVPPATPPTKEKHP